MTKESILFLIKGLDTLLLLLGHLPEVVRFIEQLRDKAVALADEGRDPTPAEWDELDRQQEELRNLLHQ